jgi:hypothetical protein
VPDVPPIERIMASVRKVVPLGLGATRSESEALLAEIERLRAEVARLSAVTAEGGTA